MGFIKHNHKGVSEMHSIADYAPSKYMLDTTDEYMGKLLVISTAKTRQQVSVHDISGVIVADVTLAEETSLLRKNAMNIPLDDEAYAKHVYSLCVMEFLDDVLYVGKKQGDKWQGYNCVTRNVEYLTSNIKDSIKKYKVKADVYKGLEDECYKQLVNNSVRAYAVTKSNDKVNRKRISVNPQKDFVTTLAILKKYVNEFVATLRTTELLVRYIDEGNFINTYVVSLSEGYINKYFPERAEKIKRCLYTPDKAVINLPVICNNGECIIKQVNVFLISNIIFRNQNTKNYGF